MIFTTVDVRDILRDLGRFRPHPFTIKYVTDRLNTTCRFIEGEGGIAADFGSWEYVRFLEHVSDIVCKADDLLRNSQYAMGIRPARKLCVNRGKKYET